MNLYNERVAVLGLGVENRPLLSFLIKKGARVTVCDKDKEAIKQIAPIDLAKIAEVRLGSDYLENLADFRIIFRTPGIPLSTPALVRAQKHGVIISSATRLFFQMCPAKIIGITGTKGKGTTAALIHSILQLKIKEEKLKIKSWLAGNIGTPMISILEKIQHDDFVILELSSFQLQDLDKSPHIAVVLNITSDHLDYHRSNREYIRSKEKIVAYQKKSDYSIINMDYLRAYRFAALTAAKVFWFSRRQSVDQGCFVKYDDNHYYFVLRIHNQDKIIADDSVVHLRGGHNLENICAASLADYLAGAKISTIRKGISLFQPLEHRLEFVAQKNGIGFYNDSYSTTPQTTIAAIQSFEGPLILICGGRSKGGDYRQLVKAILKKPPKSVILIGEIAKEMEKELKGSKSFKGTIKNLQFANMDKIVQTAYKEAEIGDTVLFSPGAASFDMFCNATERGKMFKNAVLKLKE